MAEWQTPKTDWQASDRLNIKDFNRIKNNLTYLHEQASIEFEPFTIDDMGADMESITERWRVESFNAMEQNLDTINEHILKQDYGMRQTFYENGVFIGFYEVNRLESATLGMKQVLEGIEVGKIRLPFRLGAPKGLYV